MLFCTLTCTSSAVEIIDEGIFEANGNSCSCNCHKDGMVSFIWKVLVSVCKVFGIDKSCSCVADNDFDITEFQPLVSIGEQGKLHIQGVAIDKKNGYLYYSFTDKIVKSDLKGNIIGSISGFYGHIGCIVYNEIDGKVYATLEYKHDDVGQNIIGSNNPGANFEDGFYIVIFDVDKIIGGNYNISENTDMMKTVYLSEVLDDYKGTGRNKNGEEVAHKYGCSGIDGLCIAPLPGEKDGDLFLYVAYGIYSDINRNDNDNQIILCYNIADFPNYAEPFDQKSMHKSGPEKSDYRFFVYTGNTKYGIQNLAYDEKNDLILMSVYPGKKYEFDNYSLFAIDTNKKPIEGKVRGTDETGLILTLKCSYSAGGRPINGWYSELGSCGMCYVDNGYFYLAESIKKDGIFSANIILHKFDVKKGFEKII